MLIKLNKKFRSRAPGFQHQTNSSAFSGWRRENFDLSWALSESISLGGGNLYGLDLPKSFQDDKWKVTSIPSLAAETDWVVISADLNQIAEFDLRIFVDEIFSKVGNEYI